MQGRRSRQTHRFNSTSSKLLGYGSHRAAFEALEDRRMLAGVPELLKDINATNAGSDPSYVGALADAMYFTSSAGELWRSDGSTAGTELVSDISPGEQFSNSFAGVLFNDQLYFITADPSTYRLWRTSGTPAGTIELWASPRPSYYFAPDLLVATSEAVYFASADDEYGVELWTSDGTSAGTRLVKDIAPGPASASIGSLAVVGGMLYFHADDGIHGAELWRSDGTEAGTQLVSDARPGADGIRPSYLTNVDGKLMFVGGPANGRDRWIWTSDGTAAGTRSIDSVMVDENGTPLFSFNGELYFAGWGGDLGSELWKSDGTVEGTVLVKDLNPELRSRSVPRHFAEYDGLLYFQAQKREIWRTDGTEQGTVLVATMPALVTHPFQTMIWGPQPWGGAGGRLLFYADDGDHGPELWRLDEAGAALVADVQRDASGWDFFSRFGPELNGVQFFSVNDGTHGDELWRSDGTEAGTFLLRDLNSTPTPSASDAESFIQVGDITYFVAKDAYHGRELWRTDGTSGVTRLVKDLSPGARDSGFDMANIGGTLVFTSRYRTDEGSYSSALWRSDGTEEGTVLVYEFKDMTYSPGFDDAQVIDGVAYFRGRDETTGYELWRSDGTAAGTRLVADVMPGASGSHPSVLTNVDGVLYFAANDGSGNDLWKSDGTAAGTVRVKDFDPSSSSAGIDRIYAAEGRVYFFVRGIGPDVFWTSDGTEEGTIPLGSALLGANSALGSLFVYHKQVNSGTQMFVTDGTISGTRALQWGYSRHLTNVNGTVFFDGEWGLHKTDGTVAGTVLVKAFGPGGVHPKELTNVNGTLFFLSDDRLWKSDGTEAGTVPVDDSLQVDDLYAVGSTLYIINRDPIIGAEPWILHVPAKVVDRHLFYNDSAFDDGNAAANATDDGAVAPDKTAYLPGTGRSTTANLSSYVLGINGVMVDIAGLDGELTADDFIFRVGTGSAPESWALAPAPLDVVVRAGEGTNGSDRVTITWAGGAIKNTWLQVVVKGNNAAGGFNTNTGLAESDVFFFGSRVGDTFDGATALATTTNARDELAARFAASVDQAIISAVDFNRDGLVNAADQLIARNNGGMLLMLEVDALTEELAALSAAQHLVAASRTNRGWVTGAESALAFALALGDDDARGEELTHDAWRGRKR